MSIEYSVTDFVVCFPLLVFLPISPTSSLDFSSEISKISLTIEDFPTPEFPEKAEVFFLSNCFSESIPISFLALTYTTSTPIFP